MDPSWPCVRALTAPQLPDLATVPVPYPLGTYVLATKYDDGDPGDAWAVGFYAGLGPFADRHQIVDAHGLPFRANGFRRVGAIAPEVGAWLLGHARDLEQTPPGAVNLWDLITDIPC